MDRISRLPECILHHILSFFDNSPEELVRMSVLSKTWFNLTASFPLLDFDVYSFTSKQTFFNYLEYSTSRVCLQNVPAHKLKIFTTLDEPAEFDVVNRCLELLLNKGVRELDLYIANSLPLPKYRLPDILLSVSVLKSLTICWCHLPSSLMADGVKFQSLTRLTLINLQIDDQVIKHLTTCCPLLQLLNITHCHGFKTFCVYGHQNLQQICIDYNTRLERIDIEAPNLSCLFVVDRDGRGAPQMNLASCKKLTTVTYSGHPSRSSNVFTNFPFIEDLFLVTNKYKCNNLTMSSHSLRSLLLHSNHDLDDIEFNTPNLVLFIYSCNDHLLEPVEKLWPLLKDSTHLKACMQCYPDGDIDALWFQKLRRFLDKKTGFKVFNLYIHAKYTQNIRELEKLKAIQLQPYELEHVELQLDTHEESSAHVAFVEAVLWCCRPRSLTLRSSASLTEFEEQSYVVKFTYEKLLQQEAERHTDIQIVSPSSWEAQKHSMDLNSLSMALPCEGKAFTFTKAEGTLFKS